MRLFDLPQASHFCAPTQAAAGPAQSLATFHASLGKGITVMTEGTMYFQVHQENLLRSVERWLVFGVGDYRRALDMLVPVSAPWAQVTLYYSSFYAANAILGMFGGWIGNTQAGARLVDVEHGTSGAQAFRIHKKLIAPSGATGSHRVFWDIFYDATAAISAWAPANLIDALTPVNGDYAWQIAERNNVNYDMFHAWASSTHFYGTFKPAKLSTLSGPLRQQLETTEQLLRLALHFANAVGLAPESLAGCGVAGSRTQIQRRLVTQKTPSLVTQSALADLLAV